MVEFQHVGCGTAADGDDPEGLTVEVLPHAVAVGRVVDVSDGEQWEECADVRFDVVDEFERGSDFTTEGDG